ncbi:glycosyltransferase family 4 protein [Arthrobacter sp. FW305-BF8]|uniref:glycosyltransferase family 4 protein n=1 Tax=Arthrobacter sp. FW305-BF8 TaxID=2879617 RepID=UPI001F1FBFA7|nr:glycosyltransferase family 4 protein [Arthrobacter sp. FW305-BF8]UKA56551.1 glycosyltransferase family 4 protein [Arthrobacter sp. FW305-BF8]
MHFTPERSGNAPYTSSLARGLQREGHSVTVITGYPHYPEWRRHAGYKGRSMHEMIDGVRVKRLNHYVPSNPTGLRRILMEVSFGLHAILSKWQKPDLVILVSPALLSTGLASLRASVGKGLPTLVWVQDLYSRGMVETGSTGVGGKVAAYIESSILRSADTVVAIHDRFRTHITQSLGVDSQSVKVIRNWTHLGHVAAYDVRATRKARGWADSDVIVLHAGNMGMKQGLENVVESARLAHQRRSLVKFVLMGDGNQRQKLERIASGIDNIEFIDALPDDEFQQTLGAANVLLVNELPAVRDMSVPSKLTSYFNAGVVVVAATDAESVTAAELQASGGGMRVNPDDPAALLATVELLGQDAVLARDLGAQGRKFRDETLSEAPAIAHYNEYIISLATSRGR